MDDEIVMITSPLLQANRAPSADPIARLTPLLLVVYSYLLLPPEVAINLAGLNLPSYRIALLIAAIPSLIRIISSGGPRINLIDVAMIFLSFWVILSFATIYGVRSGLLRGFAIIVDTGFPYLVARACVGSFKDLRYFLLLSLPGFLFAGSALTIESLSGQLWLRPAFASVLGNVPHYSAGEPAGDLVVREETRLGLLRAYGPFSHPILAGVVMASILPLYYFSGLRSWPYLTGVAASLSAFFSLSSAAILGLLIAGGAMIIDWGKRFVPKLSWWTIASLLALLIWALHVASTSGIIAVVGRLTLSPGTAGYRMLIWEHASTSVASHPWFGIGYQSWARPSWMGESVDAHFLYLALRHGLAVPLVLLAAIAFAMVRLGMLAPWVNPVDRRLVIGINIALFMFLVMGQTVTYFGSTSLAFMVVIAFAAMAVDEGLRQQAAARVWSRACHRSTHRSPEPV